MVNWKDYLPNLKDALTGFYEEQLKNTVESKTTEFTTQFKINDRSKVRIYENKS